MNFAIFDPKFISVNFMYKMSRRKVLSGINADITNRIQLFII